MYNLKLWNKEWGEDARFIAYDPKSKKYTEFSPRHPKDVVWVSQNLTQAPAYKSWDSCDDEPILELEDATI